MTEKELVQWCLDQMAEYRRTVSPKEALQRLIDAKIINEKGEVLVTKAEKESPDIQLRMSPSMEPACAKIE